MQYIFYGFVLPAIDLLLGLFWWLILPCIFFFVAALAIWYGIFLPNERILDDGYSRRTTSGRIKHLLTGDMALHIYAFLLAILLAVGVLNLADRKLDRLICSDVEQIANDVERKAVNRLIGRQNHLKAKLDSILRVLESKTKKETGAPTTDVPGVDDNTAIKVKTEYELKSIYLVQFASALEAMARNSGLVDELQRIPKLSDFDEVKQSDESVIDAVSSVYRKLGWAADDQQFRSMFVLEKPVNKPTESKKTEDDSTEKSESEQEKGTEQEKESEQEKLQFLNMDAILSESVLDIVQLTITHPDDKPESLRLTKNEIKDVAMFYDLVEMSRSSENLSSFVPDPKYADSNSFIRTLLDGNLATVFRSQFCPDPTVSIRARKTPISFDGITSSTVSSFKIKDNSTRSLIEDKDVIAWDVFEDLVCFVFSKPDGGSEIYAARHTIFEHELVAVGISLEDLNRPTDLFVSDNRLYAFDQANGIWKAASPESVRELYEKRLAGNLAFEKPIFEKVVVSASEDKRLNLLRSRKAWDGIYGRLGTNYGRPTGRQVLSQLLNEIFTTRSVASEKFGGRSEINNGDLYFLLSILFSDVSDLQSEWQSGKQNTFVDPDNYQLRITNFEEQAIESYLDNIEKNVIAKIDNGNRGSLPFTLGITWTTLRSMIRGPIQLVTFVFFFWGSIILVFRGYVSGLLAQIAFYNKLVPWDESPDRHHLRWCDVWIGQHNISGDSSFVRQMMASSKRKEDLLPMILRRLFSALCGGADINKARREIEASTKKWRDQKREEYVFLDFVGWVLPSIGFLGTVIGLGQGLALANKIVSPDQAVQAESISLMTSQLGTAFYTTLVALVCVIPFTFFRFLLGRLQGTCCRFYESRVNRLLFGQLNWETNGNNNEVENEEVV